VTRLTGTGLLADDLYLLAHDDVTGRPFLQPRALGTGLGGSLLAELVFTDAIRTTAGRVVLTGNGWAHDRLGDDVLCLVARDRERRPIGEWLAFLATGIGDRVADRLADAGYLKPVSSRRPWRPPRFVPVNSDCAFAPLGRMRAALDPGRTAAERDVALAGLAAACGLGSRLLPFGPPGARRHLDDRVRRLSPDLRELVGQVQATVDAAVLSHRR
jgi:hypothetical protein